MVIQRARGRTHRAAYHGPGPSYSNAFIIFFPSHFLFDMAKDMFYLFFSEEGDGEDASEHGQNCGVGFFCCFLAACPLQSQLPLWSHSTLAAVVVFASIIRHS